ncbi:hypothetical protein KR084_011349 [Drosophila pseudotakahashii]|nr:hypothetical protein KR084_011349 [Drosophila pseudotakahashii]
MQLRGDYSSTTAVNSALAKTIVTISAPPVAAASASSLHLGGGGGRPNSVSTLTIASVPPGGGGGSLSGANSPLAPSLKALTPGPSNSSGHHVSFMPMTGMKRLRSSNASLGSPNGIISTVVGAADTTSAPSLILDAGEDQAQMRGNHHRILEQCQSVQSQITTLGDVEDDDEEEAVSDSESESIGLALVETTPQLESQPVEASSSSSSSVK